MCRGLKQPLVIPNSYVDEYTCTTPKYFFLPILNRKEEIYSLMGWCFTVFLSVTLLAHFVPCTKRSLKCAQLLMSPGDLLLHMD